MTQALLLCRSRSLTRHFEKVFKGRNALRVSETLPVSIESQGDRPQIIIVHSQSFGSELDELLQTITAREESVVVIASDIPTVDEMLKFSKWKIRGYCNSYMADIHYRQLVRMISEGQNWFPPYLLQEALQLASRSGPATNTENVEKSLEKLTKRENEVAHLVTRGMGNREIAEQCNISERTVKAHLTHIYKKLQMQDRVRLALYVNRRTA
ncbi:MAG: DNA-binding response regulator [Gammaproteobacteria bacterium]|nr:DNA-binding response regulator [Gammaproteobacteria bacterium]